MGQLINSKQIIYACSNHQEQHSFQKIVHRMGLNHSLTLIDSCKDLNGIVTDECQTKKLIFSELLLKDGEIFDLVRDKNNITLVVLNAPSTPEAAYKAITSGAHDYITRSNTLEYSTKIERIINNHIEDKIRSNRTTTIRNKVQLLNSLKEKNHNERAQLLKLEILLSDLERDLITILNNFSQAKSEIKHEFAKKIHNGILPLIEAFSKTGDTTKLELLEQKISKLSNKSLSLQSLIKEQLTPTEQKICDYITLDFKTKDMAKLLNTAISTINDHKKNIRKKLGITNFDVPLKSFLLSPENKDKPS